MSITIVTAFFDIGRGDWKHKPGHPAHLRRRTKTYFKRFAHLASLNNDMVVFTSQDLAPQVQAMRQGKPTHVVAVDYVNDFAALRDTITQIQQSAAFKASINPIHAIAPEYCVPDYALVTLLKPTFLRMAIERKVIRTELVAWIDFGYCHDEKTLAHVAEWDHAFDPSKIHLFCLKKWAHDIKTATPQSLVHDPFIQEVIANNDAFVVGGSVVAGQQQWLHLDALYQSLLAELIHNNWIDDDQSLFLMAYLLEPERFEIHEPGGWFNVFKNFNNRSSMASQKKAWWHRLRMMAH